MMALTIIVFSLGVRILVRAFQEQRDTRKANHIFADEVCEIFMMPRVLTELPTYSLVADIDAHGNSVLLFGGEVWRIPQHLVASGIDAWSITEREAWIILTVNQPGIDL